MTEESRSNRLLLAALGVAALVAVPLFLMNRGEVAPEASTEVDRTWHFASVRTTDDPAKPSNAILIHTGDRLMGWSAQTDEHCYSFLQDTTKLETAAEESRELDNNGLIQEVVGVQLGAGRGLVQLVVLCTPKPIQNMAHVLGTINAFPLKPDARLEALLRGIQKMAGQAGVRIARSGWYSLNVSASPGGAAGVVGAPEIPAETVKAVDASGSAVPGASGEAAGEGGNRPGMGADGVPAGGSVGLPVTPR